MECPCDEPIKLYEAGIPRYQRVQPNQMSYTHSHSHARTQNSTSHMSSSYPKTCILVAHLVMFSVAIFTHTCSSHENIKFADHEMRY